MIESTPTASTKATSNAKVPKVQLLLTGDELMSGVTTDSNSAMIAEKLARIGLTVRRKVTVGDDIEILVSEIDALSLDSDVVVVNGGLGPTVDDLTALAVGRVVGQPLVEFPEAIGHLKQWCKQRNYPLNEANLKQALLPKGATVIPNTAGSAVGFSVEWNNCLILCTPGVPSELRLMLDLDIASLLMQRFNQAVMPDITRLQMFGLGESSLQQIIYDRFPDWPEGVEVSFRAGVPTLELKLTTLGKGQEALKSMWKKKLMESVGDCVVGEEDATLQQAVVELLAAKGQTLTTVESCTGGRIASSITAVAGASAVFSAGFVTYSNEMKEALVGVSGETLSVNGAVSEAVVKEMVKGALKKSGAGLGVAVSGIAGPGGGTPLKPVGTVWVAWGNASSINAQCFLIRRERKLFQQMVSAIALDLIRRQLLGVKTAPAYFSTYGPTN